MKGWFTPEVGFLRVTGRDSRDYLHRLLSCNIKDLAVHQTIPGGLLNALGRLIAPLWCWGLPDEEFLLQTPAACLDELGMRLERYVFSEDVVVSPTAGRLWQLVGVTEPIPTPVPGLWAQQTDLVYWHLNETDLSDSWQEAGLVALTPQQAETHRILQGVPAWGQELDAQVVPLGLNWDQAFDHDKGCYTGQEVISRLTFVGHPPHQLLGVKLKELLSELPTPLQKDGESIGSLTSCGESVTKGVVGLARIRWQQAGAGEIVQVKVGENFSNATLVALPFTDVVD
ncbi:folate-binding protein YgfZ [Candidatus Cyanaurora vandensis]|uniref:CAF17-like 4Fe-4S cluster assembly/insertion protein YgfZ n=1 Tax=Candidatus Cyanaurora vandensis TaxID=2714958 RepID=UPI00257D618D|nr:hypothetical protein [Candidatus Cyanaurora vandensis]